MQGKLAIKKYCNLNQLQAKMKICLWTLFTIMPECLSFVVSYTQTIVDFFINMCSLFRFVINLRQKSCTNVLLQKLYITRSQNNWKELQYILKFAILKALQLVIPWLVIKLHAELSINAAFGAREVSHSRPNWNSTRQLSQTSLLYAYEMWMMYLTICKSWIVSIWLSRLSQLILRVHSRYMTLTSITGNSSWDRTVWW